jgi:hypothetical protein
VYPILGCVPVLLWSRFGASDIIVFSRVFYGTSLRPRKTKARQKQQAKASSQATRGYKKQR